MKMRIDASEGLPETDPEAYQKRATLAREVASILRKNIVQAERVKTDEIETWSACILILDELGSSSDLTSYRTAYH